MSSVMAHIPCGLYACMHVSGSEQVGAHIGLTKQQSTRLCTSWHASKCHAACIAATGSIHQDACSACMKQKLALQEARLRPGTADIAPQRGRADPEEPRRSRDALDDRRRPREDDRRRVREDTALRAPEAVPEPVVSTTPCTPDYAGGSANALPDSSSFSSCLECMPVCSDGDRFCADLCMMHE